MWYEDLEMSGTIYWKAISNPSKIIDMGSHWSYMGKTVTWNGHEALDAQKFLKKHAKVEGLFGSGFMGV